MKMKKPVFSTTNWTLRAAISIIFVALCAASASAQTADKIVKQAVKAMTNGKGERALREIRSWQVKGTITNLKDGSSGGDQAAATQPDLYVREFDLRGLEGANRTRGRRGLAARVRFARIGRRHGLQRQIGLDSRLARRAANVDRRRESRLSDRSALPQRPMARLQKREIEARPRRADDGPGEDCERGRPDHGQERQDQALLRRRVGTARPRRNTGGGD